ncbi:hypothetical protein ACFWOG_39810 [Kitasatospora sp. NPDC058406]|uniref:hypothetical protein n=1 Tax=Kitasatospora sp. NPDC058406 TaxID=3346483 RepID=UPI00365DE774
MGSPRFSAPPPNPEPPAVDAFLSAVDSAMNSNTLLLTADCDALVTAGNRRAVLHAFLRSALFERLMRAADARRNWYVLADAYDSEPFERPLLREGFRAAVSPLDRAGFLARLRWMLCEAYSPYGHHYPAADAERLVCDFARELLGEDGPAWSFAAVSPDTSCAPPATTAARSRCGRSTSTAANPTPSRSSTAAAASICC